MRKDLFKTDGPVVAFLLISGVALLIYSNTFSSPFHFDDNFNIVQYAALRDLSNFWPVSGIRYVGYLSFALNYHFGALNVFGYHLVNLTIHVLNGFLVWWLVFLTLKTPAMVGAGGLARHKGLMALAAALLFVAHPIQTQAVTYIVQRFASLATLFYLLSLVMYLQAWLLSLNKGTINRIPKEPRSWFDRSTGCYLIALLSAVLAMKTKEISFTLPLIVVLYEFIFLGSPDGKFRIWDWKRFARLVPFLGTLLIIPLSLLKADRPAGDVIGELGEAARETESISRGDYLLTQFKVLITYLRLLVLPVNQNLDYDYPVSRSFDLQVFFSLMFLLMILSLGVYLLYLSRGAQHRGLRLAAFGIFWFFITLSVESSVIPIRDVIFEHRLYLPSAGVALALVSGLFYLFESARPKVSPILVTSILLLVTVVPLGIATYHRNVVWKEAETLWEDVVRKSPYRGRGHMELGRAYEAQGRMGEAFSEYKIALDLAPNYTPAHINLGGFFVMQGRLEEASREYRIALRLAPDHPKVHYNLGVLYEAQGRLEEAYKEYRMTLSLSPNFTEAHINLGVLDTLQGRWEEAYREFSAALKLSPDNPKVYYNLGLFYHKQERLEEAVGAYRTALRLSSDLPQARINLGVLYATQRRWDEAYQEFMAALKLSPDNPKVHYNLGKYYESKGMKEEAKRYFETALKLKPDFTAAQQALQ